MNRWFSIVMLCIASMFCGCELPTVIQEEEPVLTLDRQDFEVTYFGGKCTVTVTANYEFEVVVPTDVAGWVKYQIQGAASNLVNFIVSAHDGYDARTAEIEIRLKDKELSETVTIVQGQKDVILLDENEFLLTYESGTFSVPLASNVAYEITTDATWLAFQPTKAMVEEEIVFAYEENDTLYERKAEIRFKTSKALKKIYVTQRPYVREFRLGVIHDLERFQIPSVTGFLYSAKVLWGDDSEEDYSEGLWHDYQQAGDVKVELVFEAGMDEHVVTLNSMVGIKEIDLSGL